MHQIPPSLSIWDKQFQYFLRLLFCHHLPMNTAHMNCYEILCLYVYTMCLIVEVQYREGVYSVQKKSPLILIPWKIYPMWFLDITSSAPHGMMSYSTTPFSSNYTKILSITQDSCETYMGVLYYICGWLPVSIWNENSWIGRKKYYSQNKSYQNHFSY